MIYAGHGYHCFSNVQHQMDPKPYDKPRTLNDSDIFMEMTNYSK